MQNRDFVRLWLANGLWWQGMWMEFLVVGWLALSMTDSAWKVALVGFFRSLPLLVIGLFSAAITDRCKRRFLITVSQFFNAVGMGLLALLFYTGSLEYWHIVFVALTNGAGWTLDWPTRRALIPDLVGKERVVEAMMLENFMQSLTRISGPLGAGSLLAGIGTQGSLVILTTMSCIATLILLGLRTDSRSPAIPRGIGDSCRSLMEGLSYIRHKARILGVLLITLCMNLWVFPYMVLLPVIARDVLHQGPLGLGFLGAAQGAGTLLGLLVLNQVRNVWNKVWIFAGGSLLTCLGLAGLSLSSSFYLSLAMLIVAGVGHIGFSTMQSGIILVEAADEMRSRAMGAVVLAIGGGPLGALQGGALAEAWGASWAVGGMASFGGLAILAVALLLPGFRPPVARVKGGTAEY